jgi:hypothetical protein
MPAGEDGHLNAATSALTLSVSARIGGLDAEVVSNGAAEGAVSGIVRITARVPEDIGRGGPAPVEIIIDGVQSQPGIYITVEGEGVSAESPIEVKLRELKVNSEVPTLPDVQNDRIAIPANWLALV